MFIAGGSLDFAAFMTEGYKTNISCMGSAVVLMQTLQLIFCQHAESASDTEGVFANLIPAWIKLSNWAIIDLQYLLFSLLCRWHLEVLGSLGCLYIF